MARTKEARREAPTGVIARTRYVVGIDLGTTNSALAYVDRRAGEQARAVRSFEVEQLTQPGICQPQPSLPSALYLPHGEELSAEQLELPWDDAQTSGGHASGNQPRSGPVVVGELARARGALTPDRGIHSAKSWLCHPGVDRKAQILPWGAPEDVPTRSPVEVEATILRHLRAAWDHTMADGEPTRRLEEADIIVTVPASFDEVARELTVLAVAQSGLEALLIEEPQAALYAWIALHEDEVEDVLSPGETILVCDVGGGTTDFSLIQVDEDEDGELTFERTAVGDHLLLGGDNMDLALARRVESKLGSKKLDLRGWHGLVQSSRRAKERILGGEVDEAKVSVPGRGRKLVGGARSAQVTRKQVEDTIVSGFFPYVKPDERRKKPQVAGLREFGLPYEQEPRITRHLLDFLTRHAPQGEERAAVHHVLFNGGVFKTEVLRQRVLDVLGTWQERPQELEGADLDLAVARGAAYYGLVRRGKGTRIKSGAGRSYYIEVRAAGSEARTALCLIPRGLEEGQVVTIADHPLALQANVPVVFPFHSATDRDDEAGAVVSLDSKRGTGDASFLELAPLNTVIRMGKKRTSRLKTVPVELVARYTELGTLEMWCQAKEGERRWRLELDTRPYRQDDGGEEERAAAAAASPDDEQPGQAVGFDPAALDKARKLVISTLRLPAADAQQELERLGKNLEELLGQAREGWPVPVIRTLFDALLEERAARERSPAHEARWTNLAGFCLRPGFGASKDFARMSEMWRVYLDGMVHANKEAVRLEWTVAWRRVAGGLNRGQQENLFSPVQPRLLGGKKSGSKQELAELWRLAASLEHLSAKKKRKLGNALSELLEKGKAPPRWGPWSLGRLGSRVPAYGPLDRLVSADTAAGWLTRLLALEPQGREGVFALIQLGRRTGDRARDVPDDLRKKALRYLKKQDLDPRTLRPLEEVVRSELRTERDFYGDSLPMGLVLQDV